ncbi:GDP-L-fucose synthase family protein [Hoeflea olei]|uniref:GDP-L-fucose synthase n=1 Tax=Hoeflea olei TaxID=1480615 RepID=A0A1C1YY00_9HYPH|nr:GDP-L-fucose synthase [Hoeflea olei]OCW58345.1 GDP-fucose synthetase [Hoeflea olei]
MKILLTGGNGMVGRNIRDRAEQGRHELVAPPSRELDLTDAAATESYVAQLKPDMIIHAAGRVGGIQANMAHPVEFLVENLDMGRNIVIAARKAGVPQLINIGSSCMYPRAAPNPLEESAVLTGELEPTNEGYALAKVMTARLCDYVSRSDPHLSYKTLIPCNLFGLHDKFDPAVSHLLPAIIRKVDEAKRTGAGTVEIWGSGEARREFMFASDLADGIWTAVERFDELPATMNMGVGTDHSINDYYAAVARVIGWQGSFTHDLSKPVGMKQKLVSVALQQQFGWMPATPLDEAIAETYAHYRTLEEASKETSK